MALESLAGPMEEQENPLNREHSLSVVLPGGVVKAVTVHGSTPVMDLLVTLCARYHLNPTDHTVEVLSPNRNNIAFKPNCPIGLLEAERILLKPKVVEEKIRRPYVPEATVRLLINYKKSHKAVVRVNPKVPLAQLMPAVCEKCEFEVETTVLLRDAHSEAPLDPAMSLNDYGLREVYAKDTAVVTPTRAQLPTPTPQEEDTKARRKEKKHKETTQKENKGFFGLFKRSKKKLETDVSVSAPASPTLNSSRGAVDSGPWSHGTMPADAGTKKRRAPPPPPSAGVSQSVPENLSTRHLTSPDSLTKSAQSRVSSAESSLKRTKRKAPPPPPPACADTHLESPQDAEVTGPLNQLYTVEEQGEHDELASPSPFPSPPPPPPSSSSSSSSSSPLRLARVRPREAHVANPSPLLGGGEDPPSPSVAVARIMNHALAAGVQLKPVQSSSTLPRLRRGSSSPSPDQERRPGVVPARVSSFSLHATAAGDPALRKGTTTFTVVPRGAPRRRLTAFEAEPTPGVLERAERDEGGPAAEAADEAGDRRAESPGSMERAEVKRPVSESDPTSGVSLSARFIPPCTGTEAQATLPPTEMDQTSLPPEPDHLSPSPEAKPDHLSPSPEAKPDHLSPSPEAKPDYPSMSPEAKPDYPSMSPEAKPDYPSMSPEAKPDYPSMSPEAKPDYPSMSPEAKPDYPSMSPEAKPDYRSMSPEAKPDYPSMSPEAKPDHRPPPLDLAHTSPPPKVTEEDHLAERAEVTDSKEAACASPRCNPEEPHVPRSPSVPIPQPPARDDVSAAEREGSGPHPDVEAPNAAPVQREREEVKGEKEVKGEEEVEDNAFPPPPPPVCFHEEAAEEGNGASPPPARAPPAVPGCCGDHLTHLTSPKPYRPPSTALARVGAAPSRFAQAVAQAVQRSQLRGRGRPSSGGSPGPGSPSSQNGTASVKTSS